MDRGITMELIICQVEVESDVIPDYSELYHYNAEQWQKLDNFDFYSLVPGKFIGTAFQQHDSTYIAK